MLGKTSKIISRKPRHTFFLGGAILLGGLTLFILYYNHSIQKKTQDEMKRHALFLQNELWNMNDGNLKQYVDIILHSSQFRSARIFHQTGEIYHEQSVEKDLGHVGKALQKLSLIRDIPYRIPLIHEQESLGVFEAIQINENIYVYAYSLLVVLLLAKIWHSAIAIIVSRQALHENNLQLKQEIEMRVKAEAELKEMQKIALRNAHAAGMADIATNALHNIGNVLNSVGVSSETLHQTLEKSKLTGLIKANDLIQKNKASLGTFITEDPKGKLLPDYYLQLGQTLQGEHQSLKQELENLTKKIGLIKDVVNEQQKYAKKGEYNEEVSLKEVFEDALQLQFDSTQDFPVKVVKNFAEIPFVKVQKTKLVHVMVNLIKNAKEAMSEISPDERSLTLDLLRNEEKKEIEARVSDSGMGIAPETIDKIFNHGFTTKNSGHGFGLHSAANSMTEMGSTLRAESAGPGKGATFILSFPEALWVK